MAKKELNEAQKERVKLYKTYTQEEIKAAIAALKEQVKERNIKFLKGEGDQPNNHKLEEQLLLLEMLVSP